MTKKEAGIIFVAVIVVVLLCCHISADAHLENFVQVERTVQCGDTLWGYAEEYCGEKVRKQDYIDEVKRLNDMKVGSLQAGDTIIILEAEK